MRQTANIDSRSISFLQSVPHFPEFPQVPSWVPLRLVTLTYSADVSNLLEILSSLSLSNVL